MTDSELQVIRGMIEHAKLYGAAPTKIESQRLAASMNRADVQLKIKRPRRWAMGDEYFLVHTAEGPRFVMLALG